MARMAQQQCRPLAVEPVQQGTCKVRIVADGPGVSWDYRMPEGLSCDEGTFKSYKLPVVDWSGPDEGGAIWHEWQTSEEHCRAAGGDAAYKSLGIFLIPGLWYRTTIRPCEHGLEIELAARNIGGRTFHNVVAFPCLATTCPQFHDDTLERTFIVTDAGLTALKHTDRGSGDPVRTHYVVAGMRPMKHCAEPFWGKASVTAAAGGPIIRTGADGQWTIGASWQRVAEIFQNEDSHHHCLHSVPTLDDLEPGQTKTVKGRIVLVQGPADAALKLLRFE